MLNALTVLFRVLAIIFEKYYRKAGRDVVE